MDLTTLSLDLDGLARGMRVITNGRAPQERDEVAISPSVAKLAEASVGSSLALDELGTVTVVGIVEDQFELNGQFVLLDASFARDWAGTEAAPVVTTLWLVDVADGVTIEESVGLTDQGCPIDGCSFYAYSRDFAAQSSQGVSAAIIVLGGLALVEAVLVAAAAFAVSVRRRQRELGLLAATGAERRHLAGTVLGEALLLGAIAAVVGVAVGILAIVAISPWLDQLMNRRAGPVALDPLYLAAAAGIGLLACLVAASFPARAAARLPVLVALSGRRPPLRGASRLLVVGGVLVALGAFLTSSGAAMRLQEQGATMSMVLMLAGAILGVLGFGACSPWLIDRLERLGLRLPPAARIALRDSARARSRNAPIVTAILAAFAATVAISTYSATNDAINAASWQPWLRADQLVVFGPASTQAGTSAAAELGALAAAPSSMFTVGDGEDVYPVLEDRSLPPGEREIAYEIAVGDAELLRALGGDSAIGAFEAGGVVIFRGPESPAIATTNVAVAFYDVETGEESEVHSLPATVVANDVPSGGIAQALVGTDTATRLGMTTSESYQFVVRLPRTVTEADLAVAARVASSDPSTYADAALGPSQPTQIARLILTIVSLLFSLSVTGIAVALGEAEARPDQRTLLAVGADPGIRRRIAAARAAVLTLMAGVLAVPAGLLPAWGLLANRPGLPFVIPLPEVIAAVAVLPLAGLFGALVLTRGIPAWSALRQAGS